MKKTLIIGILFFVLAGLTSLAYADLNIFLNDLNHQAAIDRYRYNTRLSNQFGIPLPRVESIVRSVDSPAHAFMLFQLGAMTGKPFDTIFKTYKRNRGKGWGVIAQRLGIKPGSPEFHALKRGDFIFSGKRGEKRYRHQDDRDRHWDRDRNGERDWDNHKDNHLARDLDKDRDLAEAKGKDKNKDMDNNVAIVSDAGKGKGKGKNK